MKLKNKNENICLQNEVLLRYLMRLYYISGFVYIQKTFFFFCYNNENLGKIYPVLIEIPFFLAGFYKNPYKPRTMSFQIYLVQ